MCYRAIIVVLAIGLATLLVGCGSTANAIPDRFLVPAQTANLTTANQSVIALRWPAAVATDASTRLAWLADQQQQLLYGFSDEDHSNGAPNVMPLASTYFAAELLLALSRELPSAKTYLDPQIVAVDAQGALTSLPLIQTSLGPDFIVDIADYIGAKFPFLMTQFSYAVRVPPIRSPRTCGLLLAMETDIPSSALNFRPGVCSSSDAGMAPAPLWYLGHRAEGSKLPNDLVLQKFPLTSNSVALFPNVKSNTATVFGASRPDYVVRSRPQTMAETATMELHAHITNLARLVATAKVQAVPGEMGVTTRYVEQYDSALAQAMSTGVSLSGAQQANVATIKKLMQTEIQVKSRRDLARAKGLLAGDYGRSLRSIRDQSYSGFNSMMVNSWGSAITLTSGMVPLNANNPSTYLQQVQSNIAIHGQRMDNQVEMMFEKMRPAAAALDREFLEFEGQRVELTVGDQRSLVAALQALYKKYKKY